ncbi:MAG: CRISPR-associated endonuclease Cas2 [Clostridia bacterium]
MRVIVFFDLPSVTLSDKREYRRFRKYLVKSGFFMLQESVYTKLALNQTVADSIITAIKTNKPSDGLVLMLCITEKQFNKMQYVVGEKRTDVINSDERLIIL